MYYVCIENNQLTAVLNYRPNVSAHVEVVEITDEAHNLILGGDYHFDVSSRSVVMRSASELQAKSDAEANLEHQEFLNSTDWKVLRHFRQKALNLPTSLTEEEYLELERQRQTAAEAIR